MQLKEIKERVMRLVSGGADSDDDSILTDLYLESLIHTGRAFVLRQDFLKSRRWSHEATQIFYPDYEQDFQTDVYVTKFMLPTGFIQGSTLADGLVYFGSSGNILSTDNFRRIKNRNELSDFLNSPVMSPKSGRFNSVLIEGLLVTIFSKESIKIKYPFISAVFNDPTALPTYNKDKDEYPLSADMITDVEQYVLKTTLAMVASQEPDILSNSANNPIQPRRK